jgi:hypothetical protein
MARIVPGPDPGPRYAYVQRPDPEGTRPDRVTRIWVDRGESPHDRVVVGRADAEGDAAEESKVAAFARLCWGVFDAADDVVGELGAGAEEKVVSDLQTLVPRALDALGKVARALRPDDSATADVTP